MTEKRSRGVTTIVQRSVWAGDAGSIEGVSSYPTSARRRACSAARASAMASTERAPDWKSAVAFSDTH